MAVFDECCKNAKLAVILRSIFQNIIIGLNNAIDDEDSRQVIELIITICQWSIL